MYLNLEYAKMNFMVHGCLILCNGAERVGLTEVVLGYEGGITHVRLKYQFES